MPNCFHGMSSSLLQFVCDSRLVAKLLYNQPYQFRKHTVTDCVHEFFCRCNMCFIIHTLMYGQAPTQTHKDTHITSCDNKWIYVQ
jgi:hypothetical protein